MITTINPFLKPDGTTRHPSTSTVLAHFQFAHLPSHLQDVSRKCAELAATMADTLPEGPDLTSGLRELLRAKDDFVRSRAIETQPAFRSPAPV